MSKNLILYGRIDADIRAADVAVPLDDLPCRRLRRSVTKYQLPPQQWMSLLGKQLLLRGLEMLDYPFREGRDLPVCYGPHGRPGLVGGPSFSISHSDGYVICLLSADTEVGADIQQDRPLNAAKAGRMLAPGELADWRREGGRAAYYWSRKEAFSKLLGLGMTIDYRKMDVRKPSILHEGRRYNIGDLPAPAGYHASWSSPGCFTGALCETWRYGMKGRLPKLEQVPSEEFFTQWAMPRVQAC